MGILKFMIVLFLSELSYRYVENVFRRVKKPALGTGVSWYQTFFSSHSVQAMLVVAVLLMAGTGYAVSANESAHAKPKNTLEKRLIVIKIALMKLIRKLFLRLKSTKNQVVPNHLAKG